MVLLMHQLKNGATKGEICYCNAYVKHFIQMLYPAVASPVVFVASRLGADFWLPVAA